MKTPTLLALALSFGVLAAHAQSDAAPQPVLSRAEVHARTAAAVRAGDVDSGFEGLRMNELLPGLYRDPAGRVKAAAASVASAGAAAPATTAPRNTVEVPAR